jgi:hypothetical protein
MRHVISLHFRSIVYIDGVQIVIWDSTHYANTRVCATRSLTRGSHRIYIIGFEFQQDSQLAVTYAGPDTFDVTTYIGGRPFYPACDPNNVTSPLNSFTLCTYKSEPTTAFLGDCTPTVGLVHPRLPGPCAKALGTVYSTYEFFAGGAHVPVHGSADEEWVSCM